MNISQDNDNSYIKIDYFKGEEGCFQLNIVNLSSHLKNNDVIFNCYKCVINTNYLEMYFLHYY